MQLPMSKDRAVALFEPVTGLDSFREIVQRHPFHWRDTHEVMERAETALRRAVETKEDVTFCTWVWNADSPPLMLGCVVSVSADGVMKFCGISAKQ